MDTLIKYWHFIVSYISWGMIQSIGQREIKDMGVKRDFHFDTTVTTVM